MRQLNSNIPRQSSANHVARNCFIAAVAVIAIYFIAPALFVLPVEYASELQWISKPAADRLVSTLFAPAAYLTDFSPTYFRWVDSQFNTPGRLGELGADIKSRLRIR